MVELTAQTFLTDAGMALVVVILVEVAKRFLRRREGDWWYDGAVILSAFVLAMAVNVLAYYGNLLVIDAHVLAILALRSIVLGALASGGYEWVTNIWNFARGAAEARRVSIENASGNVTVIGDVTDTHGMAVGDEARGEDR